MVIVQEMRESGTAQHQEACQTGDLLFCWFVRRLPRAVASAPPICLVLSCLLTLYNAVMSFEIMPPLGLWVFEPDWLLDHSQLV